MGLQTPRKMSRRMDMRFLTMESENICSAEALNIKEKRKLQLKWDDMERRHSYNMKLMSQDSYQMKRELTHLKEVKRKIHRQRSASVAGDCLSLADKRTLLLDRQRRASVSDAVAAWLAKMDHQKKKDQTRKYSLDTLKTEAKKPGRSALKSSPASDQIRYKLDVDLNKEVRKKSVTFVCDDSDVDKKDTDEKEEIIYSSDGKTGEQQGNDEYVAQFIKANNIHHNEDPQAGDEHVLNEVMYSEEGPKRLPKTKTSKISNTSRNSNEKPTESERKNSIEDLMMKLDGVARLSRKNSDAKDSDEKDENNNCDESMYSSDRPMRIKRRNTVACINTSMKNLSIDEDIPHDESKRKENAVMVQGRKRKSGVIALDPDFRALLEKQSEESHQKERLLQRRKSEPAFVLSNFLKSAEYDSTFSSFDEQEGNTTEKTYEEIVQEIDRNSNNINALYLAKNKISNALYLAKDKISNRAQTSVQEKKPKPRTVGIPYHTEMRMKRKGKITLQLKAIYMDEAEKRAKIAKRTFSKDGEFAQNKLSVGTHNV